eukprot:TRINITY_DN11736_c0_g1_i2.p1 TRINITY_DN11736_c0_g1~~TRINITY_DN11736_c0_g1_i2.p1  ORF type:complete len:129 (+),score=11.04 TRINITY_DN11736_c0_g1_i2:181-567(+)
MLYEVNVQSLNCVGCEGFGVIELERYKQIALSNPETHEAYSDMIGIFHGSSAKGMKKSSPLTLQTQGRYMVLLDMNEAKVHIKGECTDVMGELKTGTMYTPCFSCGCSGNLMTITPKSDISEFDSFKG